MRTNIYTPIFQLITGELGDFSILFLLQLMVAERTIINCFEILKIVKNNDVIHNYLDALIYRGQAEMPVHLLKFESWNVKAHA